MLIAGIIVFCIILLVLAFLAPRLSRHFQKAGDKPLELGRPAGGSAPGKLGEWLQKTLGTSRKAVRKSGSDGPQRPLEHPRLNRRARPSSRQLVGRQSSGSTPRST